MAVNAEEKPKDTQTDYDQVQENLWSVSFLHNLCGIPYFMHTITSLKEC